MATPALSLLLAVFFLAFMSPVFADFDGGDSEEYALDTPLLVNQTGSPRGRLTATIFTVKKGAHCTNVTGTNICNGVSANKGRSILQCCKKHCRNIHGDRNNCGGCGQKCKFGQLCCGGTCTGVGFNASHCGKCGRACEPRVRCEMGVCGYS